jgi:predicted RNA-binding Zn-ribbon protein involved in translation (DUF1610 family)
MSTAPDLDWTDVADATPAGPTVRRLPIPRQRGPVELARLIWNARAEASRLHRLRVETARHQALLEQRLAEQDARIYHCPGCGEWRYASTHRHGHPGTRARCTACGARQPARRAAA